MREIKKGAPALVKTSSRPAKTYTAPPAPWAKKAPVKKTPVKKTPVKKTERIVMRVSKPNLAEVNMDIDDTRVANLKEVDMDIDDTRTANLDVVDMEYQSTYVGPTQGSMHGNAYCQMQMRMRAQAESRHRYEQYLYYQHQMYLNNQQNQQYRRY